MPQMKRAVNDEELRAIDRELSHLLAVEPSPEFAARVRTRIEQQPEPGLGWWRWAASSVAVAAVILLAIVAVIRRAPAGQPVVPVHADVRLPPVSVRVRVRVPQSQSVEAGNRLVLPRVRPVRTAAPEIVIDPSLAQAVRRLVAEQRVLPEVPQDPSLDPVVVAPLKVPEIAGTGGAGLQAEIGSVRLPADVNR
jgi:hypothetical protein